MANARRRSASERASSPQKNFNRMSSHITELTASGTQARWGAEEIEYENQVKRNSGKAPKVVKVDSNPVKPGKTQVSSMATKRGPSQLSGIGRGVGLGGGMNWQTK